MVATEREQKTKRDYWLAISRKYEQSGMTRAKFCAQEKVSLSSLDNWRSILGKEGLCNEVKGAAKKQVRKKRAESAPKESPALLPVMITQSAEPRQAIQITTANGHSISIPVSVCPTLLKEVFKALGDL